MCLSMPRAKEELQAERCCHSVPALDLNGAQKIDEVMMSTQPWDRVVLSRETVRITARAMDLSVSGAKPRWVEVGVVAEKPP